MQSSARGQFLGRQVAGDRALIMAIVNRTPDSFYDRGATFSDGAAKDAAHQKIADGADVIDIGGVKAGPGSTVDADERLWFLVSDGTHLVERVRAMYPSGSDARLRTAFMELREVGQARDPRQVMSRLKTELM